MDSSTLFLIGGAALLFLWWSSGGLTGASSALSASLPSDAGYLAQLGTGQTATVTAGTVTGPAYIYYSPSTGDTYASATAPTTAQQQLGSTYTSASAPSSSPATGSTVNTGGNIPTSPPLGNSPTASTQTLAHIYSAIVAAAQGDGNFTNVGGVWQGTPYHWNYYLAQTATQPAGTSGTWPPDLGAVFPGVDLTAPMSSTTYWAGMAPYLTSNFGLHGLGGLGALRAVWNARFAA